MRARIDIAFILFEDTRNPEDCERGRNALNLSEAHFDAPFGAFLYKWTLRKFDIALPRCGLMQFKQNNLRKA